MIIEPRKLNLYDVMWAIKCVETGEDQLGTGVVNEAEQAVGPLQIRPIYLEDVNQYLGTDIKLESVKDSWVLSKTVFFAYMSRYARHAVEAQDWETVARIHNGGPNGAQKKATKSYWDKVKHQLYMLDLVNLQEAYDRDE